MEDESQITKNDAKKKSKRNSFKEGNKVGVRFGEGQKLENNGRPKGANSLIDKARSLMHQQEKRFKGNPVIEKVRLAIETYAMSADKIAEEIVKLGLCQEIEPKHRFAFLKEVNMRIFGQPKSSIEECLNQLNERMDKLYELTMPLLEATAIGDGVGVVRELMKQGKLEEVVKEIEDENLKSK